jgi:hypothetical protein
MSDYEATAYLSLEKLKEKHELEIRNKREQILKEYTDKRTYTRQLMEMKDKVKKLTFSKRYEEAEMVYLQVNEMQKAEDDGRQDNVDIIIEK